LATAVNKRLNLEEAECDEETFEAETIDFIRFGRGHPMYVEIGSSQTGVLTAFVCAIAHAVDSEKTGFVRDLLQFHGDGFWHEPVMDLLRKPKDT